MTAKVLVNGQTAAQIAITDRGFQYGDGVFETLAVVEGEALALDRHLQRLERGCTQLGFAAPIPELHRESVALATGCQRHVLKIIVTRGEGGRGYQAPESCRPNRVLAIHDWPDHAASHRDEGIAVSICHTRLASQPALAGLKHLNRIEQVLARTEVARQGFVEGLVLDGEGHVIEGTMSNLFAIRDSELITPSLEKCGVAGIVRDIILEHSRALGLASEVRPLTLAELCSADEAFLCNSIIGVWPLRQIDGKPLRVGPVTKSIAAMLVRERCVTPS